MSYRNGLIPDGELVTVPGGARLLAPVARIWLAVCAEVTRLHGWTPAPTGPLDGFRPLSGNYYAQHETFMRRYQRAYVQYAPGKVDARRYNGVLYYRKPGQAAAAVPGTSNHGWGCAVDVAGLGSNPTRYNQFAAVAYRHGMSNAEGLSVGERWHWTHPGTVTQVKNGATFGGYAPSPIGPLTPPQGLEEIDVPLNQDDLNQIDAIVKQNVANSLAHLVNFTAEIPHRSAEQVHGWQVSRVAGRPTTFLQDTVDGTTAAMSASAQIAALRTAVESLAAGKGLDPSAVTAAAEAGARRALTDFTATVTIDTKD